MTQTKPQVYIAGPMRGYPYFNFDAFYAAEVEVGERLGVHVDALDAIFDPGGKWFTPGVRSIGYRLTIFNPARYDHETIGPKVNDSPTGDLADIEGVFDLRHALGRDLAWIAENATHIYLLDGWEKSKGARAEKALADALGLTVMYQTETQVIPVYTQEELDAPFINNIMDQAVAAATLVNAATGEVRKTSLTGGEKGSKPARYDLIPVHSLDTLARLYGKGAEKYADRNWENGYDWSLSFAAMQRHAWAFWNGEDTDPEHGLPHLASVAWHAFALMEWAQTHPEYDNRPRR